MKKRRSRIPAKEAKPGLYRSRDGTVIEIVAKTNSRWPKRMSTFGIPYRVRPSKRATSPARKVWRYGWLPGDYPVLPL